MTPGRRVSVRARLNADAAGVVRLLGSVPAQAWVGLTVVLATLVYAAAGRLVGAPAVFADELIHSELAKSVASGSAPSVRGQATLDYGLVSPLLGGVAYALGGDPVSGYAVLKALNAFVMSLAAVPAFLLARRVVTPGWAAVVAALTVAVPSMAYSSLVMTEPAFYPVFLVAVLALVRALERPTYGRQAVLLAVVGLAYATRAQGLAFVPATVGAVVLHAWFERRLASGVPRMRHLLRRWWLLWGVLAGGCAYVIALGFVRGSPTGLLGRRASLVQSYSPVDTVRWSLANLADLGLYVGVVGLAALPLALYVALGRTTSTAPARIWAAATLALGLTMVGMVGAFSGSPGGSSTLHDRNLFYLAPLLLIGLALWLRAGLPRPRRLVIASCAAVVLLPLAIPFGDVRTDTWVEHVGIQPWALATSSVGLAHGAMLAAALVGVALVALVPARWGWALIATVAVAFWVGGTAASWEAERYGRYAEPAPGWIDDAVEPGTEVALLQVDPRRCVSVGAEGHRWLAYWRVEFFNRSVGPVITLGEATGALFAETVVRLRRDGTLLDELVRPVRAPYVVTDARLPLVGSTLVARSDAQGLVLRKLDGRVQLGLASYAQAERLLCAEPGA